MGRVQPKYVATHNGMNDKSPCTQLTDPRHNKGYPACSAEQKPQLNQNDACEYATQAPYPDIETAKDNDENRCN